MSDSMGFARSLAQKSWAERQEEITKGQQSMMNTAVAAGSVGTGMVSNHFMDAYVTNSAAPYRRSRDSHITIKQAANGWIVGFAPEEGAEYITYICNSAQEIGERITACLVEHKLKEKA